MSEPVHTSVTPCVHDFGGFDRSLCDCGTTHTYCTRCGERDDYCSAEDDDPAHAPGLERMAEQRWERFDTDQRRRWEEQHGDTVGDVAEAEQRGREDNADHAMCYVHGSAALTALLEEAVRGERSRIANDILDLGKYEGARAQRVMRACAYVALNPAKRGERKP